MKIKNTYSSYKQKDKLLEKHLSQSFESACTFK